MFKHVVGSIALAVLLGTYPYCIGAQQPDQPTATVNRPVVSDPTAVVPFDPTSADRTAIEYIKNQCDEPAVVNDAGMVIFPTGATEIEAPVDVDEDRGPLSTLYPALDTTTDAFYPLPCEPSIGGTLPASVNEIPTKDDVDADNYLADFENQTVPKIVDDLKLGTIGKLFLPPIGSFKPEDCFIKYQFGSSPILVNVPCDSQQFLSSNQPFEGRDIIFVHGLALDHFSKWILNNPGARTLWKGAQDPGASEYLNSGGYFRKYAESYWADHIREHLFDPNNPTSSIAGWEWLPGQTLPIYRPKANRYLLVAWSSNQTIEYAQHALLTQIQLAISSNKNVVTPPNYPSAFVRPFCSNGCIIVAHSTGPLVVSSAMGLARAGVFGPGGQQIPNYIRAQVSFSGAISGSRLATIGMAVAALNNPLVPSLLCSIVNDALNLPCTSTSFVLNSVLRDLMPPVAQGVWGTWVGSSPVPTVTVAGGHPLGVDFGVPRRFLPGLDDGVVTMNSACGNPNPVTPFVLAPSGAIVTSYVKAFDFSENAGKLLRAVQNFKSHLNLMGPFLFPPVLPFFLASACTPYRTPTGMVMPIASPGIGGPWDARNRYSNHYSFIQATLSHYYDGGSEYDALPVHNPWPSSLGLPATWTRHYLAFATDNVEETSAVTDSAIYATASDGTHLVKPSFANEMHEVIRGRKVSFKIPAPLPYNSAKCPNRKCTWWIWKRTYHLLNPGKFKQSSHYVYEFVARH